MHLRPWPLRAYFAVLVVLAIAAALAASLEVRHQAQADAREASLAAAASTARIASKQLGAEISLLRTSVANLASNPQIAQVFKSPAGCSLTFSRSGPRDRSHLDIVTAAGRTVCSSQPPSRVSYRDSPWFRRALHGPTLLAPVRDSVTGASALVYAAPLAGGVVAGFVDLSIVGPQLAALYSGGRDLAVLVTSPDGRTVITRSVEPAAAIGKSLRGTSFPGPVDTVDRRDLDGTWRLFQEQTVPGVGWRFFAGEKRSNALAAADRLARNQDWIVLGGLVTMLIALLFTYRRVARPTLELSAAVAQRRAGAGGSVAVAGPAEVVALGRALDELITDVGRSEADYRALFELHPMPMWVVDQETLRFLAVNQALTDVYGYSQDEFLAMTVDEIRPEEDREELRTQFARPDGASYAQGVFRHQKKDGSIIDVEVSSSELEFDGRAARLVKARDVSERTRLQAQLRQSQKVEGLGQLAGGIAHDFNNMLTAILGHAERASRAKDPAVVAQSIDGIVAGASSAAALTGQLLAFSRQQVLQPRVIDIAQTVVAMNSMLHRVLGDDVTLHTQIEDGLATIRIDPSQIEQVLLNLAINARDAMPEGGVVSIQASNVTVDDAYAVSRPGLAPGRYVELAVTDTGVGMDEETRSRIFEPFFTTKESGTGLGLATTFGIVSQSGGYISVYSELGHGTTFRALFPAVDAPPDELAAVTTEELAAEGHERLLLIEDEPLVRGLVTEILEDYGYTVIAAESPDEARALAGSSTHVDLIISDVMLPGGSGPALVRDLLEVHPEARCLFMSGFAYGEGIAPGELAQEFEFIGKPFTGADLARKVRTLLG